MLFSYNWLQTYFDTALPDPTTVADLLMHHSSEIDEVTTIADDTVFDISVLPDVSSWLASHRGMAKELSVILSLPLKNDPLAVTPTLPAVTNRLAVTLESATCDYYSAALIEGVKVGPSPAWLQAKLTALGQRPVNNIVDATNYVLFSLGQPLHAFDAARIPSASDTHAITVRAAASEEPFTSLTGESYSLTPDDAVITDGYSDDVLALAGVKGGQESGVGTTTSAIILESAHFERTAVRRTAQRHKLTTDASRRYENGVDRGMAQYGLQLAVKLITEIAGGEVIGMQSAGDATFSVRPPVDVTVAKINSVLGLTLSNEAIEEIIKRFGYEYELTDGTLSVTPPFERDDLVIAEDVIEEIGRIHGLDAIVSVPPTPQPVAEYNTRHAYAEKIRQVLTDLGWSEVYTSTFRAKDTVKLDNALASDKGYLRSTLVENLTEAKERNIPHRDLLGIPAVQIFEIGTVFPTTTEEEFRVALAVQTGTNYKAKHDDPKLTAALEAITTVLEHSPKLLYNKEGIAEFSLDALLPALPPITAYDSALKNTGVTYQPFSVYPAVSRDIALWVDSGTDEAAVATALRTAAPTELLARLTHLDTFEKDGRTSLAFRLVFQAKEKTLTGDEVDDCMQVVYQAAAGLGWEVR